MVSEGNSTSVEATRRVIAEGGPEKLTLSAAGPSRRSLTRVAG